MEISERDEWNTRLEATENPLVWYSDGSKTDTATGCGIYCEEYLFNRSDRLSDHSTVMQAETIAIKLCAEEMIQLSIKDRDIHIFSDSQAALKAITKSTISTLTVKDCIKSLNTLGRNNKVTLSWVPGHTGVPGNEKADELANAGAKLANVSISTPVPMSVRSTRIKERGKKLFRDLWNKHRGLTHSKMMMEPFKKGKYVKFKLKRKDLRVLIGILTGHCCLNKFLHRIMKADNPYCRSCNEEVDEDMEHLLTECPAFATYRLRMFGDASPSREVLKNSSISILLKYAKVTEIYGTFFRDG